MAVIRTKLWLTTSRIRILNVVTFLMLSAVAVADEGNSTRQCYWCGPIAEQVQRSDVAPPCGSKGSVVFTCQEGYNYCAIAATSPPYLESRFCSKVYQDECYPQYCNSTKTWRMTCTCRGDLCNENITKREMDAFAKLPREVEAKESRVKRNAENSSFALSDSEKTVIITNISMAVSNEVDDPNANDNNNHSTEVVLPEENLQIADDETVTNASTPTEDTNTVNNDNEGTNKVNNIKIDYKNELTETPEKDTLFPKIAIGSTKVTKANEPRFNTNTARPSERLPTAEALQQEASSENDENNTEHTTVDYEPTESGAADDDDDGDTDDGHVTAEPGDDGENSGNTKTADILLLVNGLLLQFIYNRK